MPVWRNARMRRLYGKPDDPIETPPPGTGSGSRTRNLVKSEQNSSTKQAEVIQPPEPTPPPPPKRIKREKTRPESEYELVHNMPATANAPDYSLLTKPVSVDDANVTAYAIHASRQNWLNGSVFETFWTRKPRGKKLAEGQVNLREKMTKLHECSVTLGPHTFPIKLFTVRDDNVNVDEEADRKIEEQLAKEKQEALEKEKAENPQVAEKNIPESSAEPLSEKPPNESSNNNESSKLEEPKDELKTGDDNTSEPVSAPSDQQKSPSLDKLPSEDVPKENPQEETHTKEAQPENGPSESESIKPTEQLQHDIQEGETSKDEGSQDKPSEKDQAKEVKSNEELPPKDPSEHRSMNQESKGEMPEQNGNSQDNDQANITSSGTQNLAETPDKSGDAETPEVSSNDTNNSMPSQSSQETFKSEKQRLEIEKRRNEELEQKLKGNSAAEPLDITVTEKKDEEQKNKEDTNQPQKLETTEQVDNETPKTTENEGNDQPQIAENKETETAGNSSPKVESSMSSQQNLDKPENKEASNLEDNSERNLKHQQPETQSQPQTQQTAGTNDPSQQIPAPQPEMPKTTPNQLVVYRLQQMAARDQALSELMKHVASGTAPPDSIAKFQEVINRVKASIFNPPPPPPQPQPKRPQPAKQKQSHPTVSQRAPPAPPKPPVQRAPAVYHPRANAKAIMLAIEFDESPTDRYLFPKRSIIEYIPTRKEMLWSFLHVSEPNSRGEKPKYTPVTATFHQIPLRIAQTMERCVRKPEVVAVYMKQAMEGAERSEPWHLWFEIERNDEVLLDLIKKTPAPVMAPPPPPRKPTKPRKPRGPTAAQLRVQQEKERLLLLQKLKIGQPLEIWPWIQPVRGQPLIQSASTHRRSSRAQRNNKAAQDSATIEPSAPQTSNPMPDTISAGDVEKSPQTAESEPAMVSTPTANENEQQDTALPKVKEEIGELEESRMEVDG